MATTSKKKTVAQVKRVPSLRVPGVMTLSPSELRALAKLMFARIQHGGSGAMGGILIPSPDGRRFYESLWKKHYAEKVEVSGGFRGKVWIPFYGFRLGHVGLIANGLGLR